MSEPATNRFFLVPPDIYEQIREGLDTAWGHPRDGTMTCLPPAADAIKDAQGRIIAPVPLRTCEWPEVAGTLASLLKSGVITEVERTTYQAWLPSSVAVP